MPLIAATTRPLAAARPVLLPALLGLALASTGCRRLPDTIPYEAHILEAKQDPTEGYRITELAGAELKLDGKAVGTIEARPGDKVAAYARWSGPKSSLRPTLNGSYSVTVHGPCGPVDVAADEGPSPAWKEMSDSTVAKRIDEDRFFTIFVKVALPARTDVYVDWGSASGVLKVGAVTIPPGTKTSKLALGGCKAAPEVTLDGRPLGTLDLSAKASLVTLEPDVCHVFEEVGYGDMKAKMPSKFLPAKGVVGLPERPGYVFESAPSTVKLYRGSTGTRATELVRASCR